LFPPRIRLFSASRKGRGFDVDVDEEDRPGRKYAFVGVRSCELHAIAIQDKVLLEGNYVDPSYASLRKDVFIVAVNCGIAGGNCFCASMNTGPRVSSGYDLVLTEIVTDGMSSFLVDPGSEAGKSVLQEVPRRPAGEGDKKKAEEAIEAAVTGMGKTMNTSGIKEVLYENFDHRAWDAVAARCLACANCTMVCPTCFCTTIEDITDLTGDHAERWRRWDSCFTLDFAKVAGGNFRPSVRARYRQWMTHKLASWIDQFGTSGCVGCGRCITWCPVGIDITAEVQAIRSDSSNKGV
jgi:formate hydrogenlyase subunit 6/NADH:ubiquinone oxidoreductase subunit I